MQTDLFMGDASCIVHPVSCFKKGCEMRLEGKTAIITGGGYGIGKAIATAFAREGADVALAARSVGRMEETAEEIRGLGRRALVCSTDVMVDDQVKAMVEATLSEFEKVDILVNNSGIDGPTCPVVEMDPKEWRETLDVNLTGAFLCSREVLKHMIPRKSGNIINIGSVAGRMAYSFRTPYAASKWGMIGFSHSMAMEVGEHNIRVNVLMPGATEGERLERVFENRAKVTGSTYDEVKKFFVEQFAMRRTVKPEEVASAVVFLASDESSGMTGQAFNVCGGMHMH
jgi:NAD(P)-dependent dehydrogenase (short-subunit alcohol dehydrogenase family)